MSEILSDAIVFFGCTIGALTGIVTVYGLVGHALGWWPDPDILDLRECDIIETPIRDIVETMPDHPGVIVPFERRRA